MQGDDSNAKSLNYYLSVDQIFREMSQQDKTKILVPAVAKKSEFSIEELLTDKEKEEDYELNLYISTFMSEETPVEHTGRIQILIKPPTAQREEP